MLSAHNFLIFLVFLGYCLAFSGVEASTSVIAHRGNSSEAPENTLSAFKSAIELGADFFELDVILSADGQPVVTHDLDLSRITSGKNRQRIFNLTYQQILEVDAGKWFDQKFAKEKIPHLKEVLQLPRGDTGIMIELKEGRYQGSLLAKTVADTVRSSLGNPQGGKILLGSKSKEILLTMQQELPQALLVGIVGTKHDLIEVLEAIDPPYLAVYAPLFLDLVGNAAIQNSLLGKTIWVWTVDNPKNMQACVQKGAQGVITNVPKLAQEVLR